MPRRPAMHAACQNLPALSAAEGELRAFEAITLASGRLLEKLRPLGNYRS
jgi:hypothetical protein